VGEEGGIEAESGGKRVVGAGGGARGADEEGGGKRGVGRVQVDLTGGGGVRVSGREGKRGLGRSCGKRD